ncbi:hypothetical protein TNCV_1897421 [Trichonephila clavipes]|nr:hypothetical protein TNCV_1897421 [Trichonephila clavipes]
MTNHQSLRDSFRRQVVKLRTQMLRDCRVRHPSYPRRCVQERERVREGGRGIHPANSGNGSQMTTSSELVLMKPSIQGHLQQDFLEKSTKTSGIPCSVTVRFAR